MNDLLIVFPYFAGKCGIIARCSAGESQGTIEFGMVAHCIYFLIYYRVSWSFLNCEMRRCGSSSASQVSALVDRLTGGATSIGKLPGAFSSSLIQPIYVSAPP